MWLIVILPFPICILFLSFSKYEVRKKIYAWAVGPPKFMGNSTASISWMVPFTASNFFTFSIMAFIKRLACDGVRIIRLFTLLFGMPGITFTKSTTNSAWLWVIIARLAY